MRNLIQLTVLVAAATVPGWTLNASEGDAKYREHVMEAVGGHMQAMVDILKQEVSHADHLTLHANAMADLGKIALTLFPAGSEGGDALPEIWEQPEDFQTKLEAFHSASESLKQTVSSGGEVGPAIQKLGQACKSCHDDYRAE
jgi:cytochrome c556